MKGLIIKDFITTKSYLKTLFMIVIAIFALGSLTNQIEFFLPILILLMSMLTFSSFTYDESCHWDVYGRTFPLTIKQVVLSKYLFGAMSVAIAAVVVSVLIFIFSMLSLVTMNMEVIILVAIYVGIALFLLAVIFPFIYRFGVEKSRLIMLVGCFLPSVLVSVFEDLEVSLPTMSDLVVNVLLMLLPLFILMFYYLSFLISLKIFSKKEL